MRFYPAAIMISVVLLAGCVSDDNLMAGPSGSEYNIPDNDTGQNAAMDANRDSSNGINQATTACPTNILSFMPVKAEDIVTLTPLGQVSPPDHVFPAPHSYIYVIDWKKQQDNEAAVYAPADMMLTSIGLRHYDTIGKAADYIDYTLVFTVCDDFDLYFHHVKRLTKPEIIAAADKILQGCTFNGQWNEDYCQGQANVAVKAGEAIATTGDLDAGVYGLDIGVRDYRIEPKFANMDRFCSSQNVFAPCYAACAFDSLPEGVRQTKYSTGIVQGASPVDECGTVHQDAAGTAQGYWFSDNAKTTFSQEAQNIFLGKDYAFPDKLMFSIGLSLDGVQAGEYVFTPMHEGATNRAFDEVKPDGTAYCYQVADPRGEGAPITLLIQLIDATTLHIKRVSTCSDIIGSGFAEYKR